MSKIEQAIATVAKAYGWDHMATDDLGLMLWTLFRYYAARHGSQPKKSRPQ